MKIIDISWPIKPAMTEYKDRASVKFTDLKKFEVDFVRESTINLHNHTGTHVDAPAHFLPDGKTVDQLDLKRLVGPCTVLDMTQVTERIGAEDIKSIPLKKDSIVLFKTKNSAYEVDDKFNYNFVFLDKSAAQLLAKKKIKAVGIDYLGIERNQPNHETHKLLLEQDIAIIEGLRLASVKPGDYFLCCLPVAVSGLDGAPARAILLQNDL